MSQLHRNREAWGRRAVAGAAHPAGAYHLHWTGPGRQEPRVRWLHPILVGDRQGHDLPPTQTTIDIYGHPWPDRDGRTRTAIDAVFDRPLARAVDGDAGTAAETGL
jgi:hypothetical protein